MVNANNALHAFVKTLGQIPEPAKMVILLDGQEWDLNNANNISGARHGGGYDKTRPYDTGLTNVLFMDGHGESALRSALPKTYNDVWSTTPRDTNYLFNTTQANR